MDGNSSMPSRQDQIKKYDRVPEPGSPAQTEAWALLEAAKRLAAAIVHGPDNNKETRELRKKALRLNWRLWTIFQAELTMERPDLDPLIRRNMLTLCQFVDKHTVGALFKPTAEALSTLIDINRNIASGLLNMPEDPDTKAAREQRKQKAAAAPERIDTKA
jgi:flagellar protein FlaF